VTLTAEQLDEAFDLDRSVRNVALTMRALDAVE
jgi:hypothetical protein